MKTFFHIENEEFADYLKLTIKDKTYYFCDDLTVEFNDCENLEVIIEYVRAEDYLKIKTKNLFLKLLLNIMKWIFSPLMFFIDNDDGIRMDKGYKSFNPFIYKKTFLVISPDEKTISINYTESKYDKITQKYAKPFIKLKGDGVTDKTEEITFSSNILKQEWNIYHIPAFLVIMFIILLLNVLNFLVFAKVIKEIFLYSIFENISGIIGMLFCSLVMITLFVVCIVVIVKTYHFQKDVISKNIKT